MKKITSNTILKQGNRKYKAIEVNGVIYWVYNTLIKDNDYYITILDKGINKWIMETPKNEFQVIVAQFSNVLDGVPIVSLDSYVEKTAKLKSEEVYGFGDLEGDDWETKTDNRRGYFHGFKDGCESNPNQYTLQDLETIYNLASAYDENWRLSKEQAIEQVNTISIIEVDNQFNIIRYE